MVRRLLSLNIFTDLDDEHLRQAELRLKLAAIPQQQYPYDLAQAVVEWMKEGDAGHPYSPPIHPAVEKDMRVIAENQDTSLNRRMMSLELYALCRMLKDAPSSKPRLAVIYAGTVHTTSTAPPRVRTAGTAVLNLRHQLILVMLTTSP